MLLKAESGQEDKMEDPFNKMSEEDNSSLTQEEILKNWYFKFLEEFRSNLTEYIKESAIDLAISSVEVTTIPQKLIFGQIGGINLTLKNQGFIECYLTTDRIGGYRLDPDEKVQFWLNKEATIVTLSGNTTVGFIQN